MADGLVVASGFVGMAIVAYCFAKGYWIFGRDSKRELYADRLGAFQALETEAERRRKMLEGIDKLQAVLNRWPTASGVETVTPTSALEGIEARWEQFQRERAALEALAKPYPYSRDGWPEASADLLRDTYLPTKADVEAFDWQGVEARWLPRYCKCGNQLDPDWLERFKYTEVAPTTCESCYTAQAREGQAVPAEGPAIDRAIELE